MHEPRRLCDPDDDDELIPCFLIRTFFTSYPRHYYFLVRQDDWIGVGV